MKLEKKQVPLFVGLCTVTVGMLGYAAFSLLGGGTPAPAAAGTSPAAGSQATPALQVPTAAKPGLPVLNPTFRADPFKPALTAEGMKPSASPAPSRAPVKVAIHETLPPLPPAPAFEPAPWSPPPAPAIVRPAPAVVPAPAAPAAPAAAPSAPKPTFTLTGILDGDSRIAILRLSDTQRQVVQEKDRVAGQYVVDEITPNAVVLVSGTERWRLFLEN